jgi:hypothetical protein
MAPADSNRDALHVVTGIVVGVAEVLDFPSLPWNWPGLFA